MNKKQEIRMLKTMIRVRTLEDKLEKLFREGRLNGHLHTYHGQEAIFTGTNENRSFLVVWETKHALLLLPVRQTPGKIKQPLS